MNIKKFARIILKQLQENYFLIFLLIFTPLLFIISTATFNLFWSGQSFPDISKIPSDQREYLTTYISLLAFLGTIEGIFIVLLSYNDWKTQHKKITISNDAKLCLSALCNLSTKLDKITSLRFHKGEITEDYKQDFNLKFDEFQYILDKTTNDFIILSALTQHSFLREDFINLYQDYIVLIHGLKKVVNENLNEIDLNYYWDIEKQCSHKNQEIRPLLMYYIQIY